MKPHNIPLIIISALLVSASSPLDHTKFDTPMVNPNPDEPFRITTTGDLDDPELLFHIIGDDPFDILGTNVEGIGDLNGDGFDDIIIVGSEPIRSELYYGGDPMDTIPDMTFGDGIAQYYKPEKLGDVNGDEIDDFALVRYQYGVLEEIWVYLSGGELEPTPDLILYGENINDAFWSVGSGDFNNDSYSDFAVGAYCYQPAYQGRMYTFMGSDNIDSEPELEFGPPDIFTTSSFGTYVSSGDLNSDDFDDLLIGANGQYLIYFGSADFDTVPEISIIPDYQSVYSAFLSPDMNLDGNDDLVMSTNIFSSGAELFVYYGNETMGNEPDLRLYTLNMRGVQELSAAGDVNHDGCGDVITGDVGEALVFLGSQWMDSYPDIAFSGSGAGWAVADPGDVNGDGIDDIMFSCKWGSLGANGQVYIYAGDESWVVGVEDNAVLSVPRNFNTITNYPNPFNAATTLSFKLQAASEIELSIYNVSGQRVWGLRSGVWEAGTHQVVWDAWDCASGVYLIQLIADSRWPMENSEKQTRKVVLVK